VVHFIVFVCSTSPRPPPTLSPRRSGQGRRRNMNEGTKAHFFSAFKSVHMCPLLCQASRCWLSVMDNICMFFKHTLASSSPFAYPTMLIAACPDHLYFCSQLLPTALHLQVLSVALPLTQQAALLSRILSRGLSVAFC